MSFTGFYLHYAAPTPLYCKVFHGDVFHRVLAVFIHYRLLICRKVRLSHLHWKKGGNLKLEKACRVVQYRDWNLVLGMSLTCNVWWGGLHQGLHLSKAYNHCSIKLMRNMFLIRSSAGTSQLHCWFQFTHCMLN